MFKNRFFNLLVAVALLTVLMLTVQEVIATKAVVSDVESASQFYATNPELSIARYYSEAKSNENVSSAANPELSAANRYAVSKDQIGDSAWLSINPELSVVRRYAVQNAGQ